MEAVVDLIYVAVIMVDPEFVSANNVRLEDIVKTYKNALKGNHSEYGVLPVEFSTSMNIKINKGKVFSIS